MNTSTPNKFRSLLIKLGSQLMLLLSIMYMAVITRKPAKDDAAQAWFEAIDRPELRNRPPHN